MNANGCKVIDTMGKRATLRAATSRSTPRSACNAAARLAALRAAPGVQSTTSAGAGLDKFLDSPAGVALSDKLQAKAEKVAVGVVKNNQVNLALLGVAGTAIVMGSVNVGSKMSPRATKLAFAVAGVALALVASGVFSPVEKLPTPPPKRVIPR
jgi:hypothetical protein